MKKALEATIFQRQKAVKPKPYHEGFGFLIGHKFCMRLHFSEE